MKLRHTLLALAIAGAGAQAQAAIVHNSEIVGNAIFGGGNADGGWTINQTGNMELALRAKVRYDVGTGGPLNVFNANGDGTFNHAAGIGAADGAGIGRARWNYEWSINTDASGTGGAKLSAYDFILGVDSDAGLGTSWHSYNLTGMYFDHSFGNNGTAAGAGVEAAPGDLAAFNALVGANNLMQNSANMAFVDDGILFAGDFNPTVDGNYSFFLEARDKTTGAVIGRTDITVIVGAGAATVSAPASLALAGLGLLALGATRRRRA